MNPKKLHFRELTGRSVKVAVVDSGIDPNHPGIGPLCGGIALRSDRGGGIVQNENRGDCAGHGTACAGIIRKKAPQADLFDVRILDESLSADGRLLLAALRWAIEQKIDLVNLSLGTTDAALKDELHALCRSAVTSGTILVAAEDNEGRETYPAAFPEVIGVTAGKVRGKYGYYYRPDDPIECVARGDAQRVCWTDPPYVMISGTSYAAPHITGIVALILQAHPSASLEEVRRILRAHALKGKPELLRESPSRSYFASGADRTDGTDLSEDLSWIRRAALYPFNKEMHSLVRYRDLLGFEITGIADPAGKGLVGRDAGEALGLSPLGLRIQPRLEAALEGADALVLGYVDQLGRIGRKDLLRESIHAALQKGCHVFSFHQVPPSLYGDLYERARKKDLRIVCPSLAPGLVHSLLCRAPELSPVDRPVLGVFGTSPQQGKFTVQLALRRCLLRRGYTLGQIGTEHHSALFGMDFTFPIGYASPVDLPLQYYAPLLEGAMRRICHEKRPDLILAGAQSGTIPYDVREHATHSLPSLAFLLGCQPDACILVVNSIDPEEYIQDAIHAIRALVQAPVILLAMSDKEKHVRAAYGRTFVQPRPMPPGEIRAHLRRLEERFSLPAVQILSEEDQERMVEIVVNYFSADREEETA